MATLPRQEQIEQLRRRMAAVPGRVGAVAPQSLAAAQAPEATPELAPRTGGLPVPGPFEELFPGRFLAKGSVVGLTGSRFAVLGFIASVTAADGHVAVVGLPELSLLAVAEMGGDLRRVAVIPDPGPDPVEVAAVLLDGVDLVVLGLCGVQVSYTRARAVTARVRSKNAVLAIVDGQWPNPEVALESQICGYRGLGRGHGRIRGLSLAVQASGRSFQQRRSTMRLTCMAGRVRWEAEETITAPVSFPDASALGVGS
ncbi:hypothetical protein ONR57_04140 [Hoyosella sp. YIM 151337]|uniref:hypothetical protein n=1 Tax=Hoyosella sp. YIM 151337 TaxID=2992742 RepID=UPI002235BF19|nr:hypothetical protein [Hoyosella sp. YIM 151337]MCW4352490.1 hypothetical protein [Hoyosella sp. YIM 151337]